MKEVSCVPLLRSYAEVIRLLPCENQLDLFWAILNYAFEGLEPSFEDTAMKIAWVGIKPNIDSSLKKLRAQRENGSRGGAPIGNHNRRLQPNSTQNNPNQPEEGEGNNKRAVFCLTDTDLEKLL